MRKTEIVIAVGLITALGAGILAWSKWREFQREFGPSAEFVAHNSNYSPPGGALPVLWSAPSFSYQDQHGRLISDRDLRGHVWVSDFFFTSCTSICPMMTARMSELQKAIGDPGVRFVSFSVDTEHDTPQVLRDYATMWKADNRWHFLSTERKKLADTAAGMRVFVRPLDKDTPIQHSSLFVLTDAEGNVRGVYDSVDPVALERLTSDALLLTGVPRAETASRAASPGMSESDNAGASPGALLYASRGCLACHTQGRVAPALVGCFRRKVLLSDGSTVTADGAYLRESILDPAAKVVAGYPSLMPSYRGQLTEPELNQLIEYLESLHPDRAVQNTPPAPEPPEKAESIDPVCKMAVTGGDSLPRAEFDGKTYYFCCPTCREQFLREPARFAKSSAPGPAP